MIEVTDEYYGGIIEDWEDIYMNRYVITGPQMGIGEDYDRLVGRVVQVRLDAGQYGSHNVLLRHRDNILMQHMVQEFQLIPEKFTPYLDECFVDVYLDHSGDDDVYNLNGEDPKRGFIIKQQSVIDKELIKNREDNIDGLFKISKKI